MSFASPDLTAFHQRLAIAATQATPWVTRFAPSPTGYLHLGHVAAAIFVWGIAQRLRAKIILRIEDHDGGRSRPAHETAILADLEWLGFVADVGVTSTAPSPYRQSDQPELYRAALAHLQNKGLIYACRCTRREIALATGAQAHTEKPYPGHCRDLGLSLDAGLPLRVRLDATTESAEDLWLGAVQQQASSQCGDMLVRDRDGYWTYQLAVVVDDAAQGVNLVVRGQDLSSSIGRQQQLARLLDLKAPLLYAHHPLINEPNSTDKLSKRQQSASLQSLRAAGWSREQVLGSAATAVGLCPPDTQATLAEIMQEFMR